MIPRRSSIRTTAAVGLAAAAAFLVAAGLPGCGGAAGGDSTVVASDRPTVAVGVSPHGWIVERLAGDSVDVIVALPPSASCHDHAPVEHDVTAIGRADIFLASGVAAERASWFKAVVDTSDLEVVDLLAAATPDGGIPNGDSDAAAAARDPHVWTSPAGLRQQAAAIAEVLVELVPERAAEIREAAATFDAETALLEDRIADVLAPISGRTIVVDHPAWVRLAHEHDLVMLAIEPEPGLTADRHLEFVRRTIMNEGIGTIIVQPQHPARAAASIAISTGAQIVSVDPMPPGDPRLGIDAAAQAFAAAAALNATGGAPALSRIRPAVGS